MGGRLESFPASMRARTKYIGKTCGDLWGQSTILKAVISNCPRSERGAWCYRWYQSRPATGSCASGWKAMSSHLAGQRY